MVIHSIRPLTLWMTRVLALPPPPHASYLCLTVATVVAQKLYQYNLLGAYILPHLYIISKGPARTPPHSLCQLDTKQIESGPTTTCASVCMGVMFQTLKFIRSSTHSMMSPNSLLEDCFIRIV